jgi:GH24 family phage-related lysozyme (muramidase)
LHQNGTADVNFPQEPRLMSAKPSQAISADGLALIQSFEGYRAEPAQLPDGNWVVGHGHVRIGEAGETLGRDEARALLSLDLAAFERSVNNAITVDITQQQFDALVSFALSIGIEAFESSTVVRRINAGDILAAGCAMDAWRKADVAGESVVIDALVRRRAAEKALFLADALTEASPSVFLRAKLDHAASILGAPIAFMPAPEVGSVAVLAPKPQPALRLTEILKSESATEALLLTQVATNEEIEADEIVTAHAKPVARRIETIPASIRVDQRIRTRKAKKPRVLKIGGLSQSAETAGLVALFVFGAALIVIGASTLLEGQVDAIGVMGATALAGPGLAAMALAAYGLVKAPARAKA